MGSRGPVKSCNMSRACLVLLVHEHEQKVKVDFEVKSYLLGDKKTVSKGALILC